MTRFLWTFLLIPVLLSCALAPPAAAGDQTIIILSQNRGRGDDVPRIDPRARRGVPPWRPSDRRGPYQEPAFARGYSDGYMRGVDDSRDRDRYDPVGHSDYRRGDQGYYRDYGSRDAYRNNYRAGFRQGYDEGYRGAYNGRRR